MARVFGVLAVLFNCLLAGSLARLAYEAFMWWGPL